MKKPPYNPFVTSGYLGPEYFCDRFRETEDLMKALRSGRNITLISQRRIGKTGLLKHVKQLLEEKNPRLSVLYVDILPTLNSGDLLNMLSTALFTLKHQQKNLADKLFSLLGRLRPVLQYDPLSGQPSLSLNVNSDEDIRFGFNHLLQFLTDIHKELIIMIDEFQQIGAYPEKNTEQHLRTLIQNFPGISFVFSGSSKHMLEAMFAASGRPFYQSAELYYLQKIEEGAYQKFITEKFMDAGRQIAPEAIQRILKWTRRHTYYVQLVCNKIFETEADQVDAPFVNLILQEVLSSQEPLFVNYRNLLPPHQYRLLQAIAAEDGVEKPTAGSFIQKFHLKAASSVKTSLKALRDKEMISRDSGRWEVSDVFFSRWLEYHYGTV